MGTEVPAVQLLQSSVGSFYFDYFSLKSLFKYFQDTNQTSEKYFTVS